jgi:hypothetical protein
LASGATLNADVALVIAFVLVGLDGAATGGPMREEGLQVASLWPKMAFDLSSVAPDWSRERGKKQKAF